MSRFIIYGLVDPRTGEVRYIGKSSRGVRRAKSHAFPSVMAGDRNLHKANWIRQLASLGMKYTVVVLGEFSSSDVLDHYERWAIAFARSCGWSIANIQDGGEGGDTWTGKRHSPETIEKMRAVKLGKKFSPEHRARISSARLGRRASDESRAKMSRSRTGRKYSPEWCANISESLKGKPSPWAAERNRNTIWTEEMRAKIGAARKLNTNKPPNAKKIYFNGEQRSIAEWSRITGIGYGKLRARIIDLGWDLERVFSDRVSK